MSEAELPSETNYTPMADPITPVEPKKKTYDSDMDGVEKAAKDLDKAREEGRVPQAESEPVDRGYKYLTGDRAGEPVEENQTLTAERAARDITMVREWEAAAEQPHPVDVAAGIDQLRAANNGQQQPQPQPEAQAQTTEQQQPDIDPEIAQALNNPKIRAALEAEVNAAESARQQFAQQARAAAQLSAASLFSFAPELASLTTEQLPGALALIAKSNPQRAMEIQNQLQRTESLYNASRQAEAQRAATQQQQQQQRFQQYVAAEEAKFEREVLAKENPATVQKIKEALPQIMLDYGLSREDVAYALQTNPALRSAAFQTLILDAARYRMAQKEVVNKIDRSAPPVQRPGVSQPRTSNEGIDSALKQFRSQATVDNAVKVLLARRNSR